MSSGVELVFGPMLIGVFLNTILYGILVMQSFIYYQTYTRDKAWIRYFARISFVLYLFILETANTGFNIGMMYEPLVVRYATDHARIYVPIMLYLDPIITALISTPVQVFIAWRIKVISGSKLITTAICFFALCALVGGIATTACVVIFNEYSTLQTFHAAVITWLASSAGADVVITGSLVYSLYHRKTGVKATDAMIDRIIRLTVQTGMITALCASADVIIFLAVPHTTLNFIWDFALSKLYTNALLSTLNARAGWRNLTGQGGDQPNILFGNNHSASMTRTSYSHHIDALSNGRQIVTTGVYELEPHITSGQIKTDLEYGVSVTKVVERLEDPIPHSK